MPSVLKVQPPPNQIYLPPPMVREKYACNDALSASWHAIIICVGGASIVQVKERLHTAINRADFVSWCMLYTYEGNKVPFVRK